ncbi:peptidoglycan-binding domain-containing protein [Pseudogemmobacter humi]|uniref:Peptidoglycan binding domain protein n=1 Tax=Pseudogemmobacter humi TaxID=2483812 RepID=A0A3P5X9A3_9RHOB|nr:peptidoglycan-binding domain-containing protein [Pseudogemmobacter humi]VDC31193.1 Putative peptidoglycan binding domain protein [Pseudogemmobacter humi]
MKHKAFATSALPCLLLASLSFAPVSPLVRPAHADGKDVIAGLIVGGLIGAAINEDQNRKKAATPRAKSSKSTAKKAAPSMSAEQRAANIEVQSALNYFGWNVGTADGVLGNKSKAAVRDYQAFLGHGITGDLTGDERTILVTSHARAEAGGTTIRDIIAGSHYGVRGVLLAQRDEMTGYGATAGMAPAGAVGAAAAAAIPGLIAAEPVPEAPAAPAPVEVAASPSLPSFMDANGANGALSADCNRVQLTATTNGGYVTAETMGDANTAIAEQFCLTRAAAITTGQGLQTKVAGVSADEIAAQCAAFGPVLKDQVAALSLRPADEVLTGVEGFIMNSGMSPAQLSGTARVCLGVGYERDQLDVAIGSALLLTAMGETSYAEMLGHHLVRGFGAAQRADLAFGWYEISLGAMKGGTDALVPGAQGREALVRKAAYTLAGRAWELAPEPEVKEAALPSFSISPDQAPPEFAAGLPEAAPETSVSIVAAPAEEAAPAPETALPAASQDAFALIGTESAPQPATPGGEAMRSGAELAAVAARLPFLLFVAQ